MINIKQKALLSALALHKGVADPKSSMPMLSCVLLQADGEVLTLRTTDLVQEIVTMVPCEGEGTINIAVSAKALYELAKACAPTARGKGAGPVISLDSTENNYVLVKGVAEMKVMAMPAQDFPKAMAINTDADIGSSVALLTYSADKLRAAVDFVLPAVSLDETRYHLNGMYFTGADIVATDGHRMHRMSGMPRIEGLDGFIMPRRAAFTLLKLLKDAIEVQATFAAGVMHFAMGDTELFVKPVDAKFPPYEQIIPNLDCCDNGFKANREAFLAAVKAAAMMSSDKTWGIKLNTSGSELYVTSDNPDLGEAKAPFPGTARGAKDWKIGVNAKYVIEALAPFDCEDIEMFSQGELDPMRFDHDGRTVVCMPMRI
jgi:DNA polymerase-3 subunit beta